MPLGKALAAGILITSATAFAEPPPAAPTAPAAPVAIAPAPPPYVHAPRPPEGGAPLLQYPHYVYVPGVWAPPTPGIPGAPSKRDWYGWQTLLVFGGSVTVGLVSGFGGGASGSGAAVVAGSAIGGAGAVFGGPIVHWAHGNIGKGFGALGLNVGAPVVGAGLGLGTACATGGCKRFDGGISIFFGLVVGGGVGLLAAMVVDVSVLSYDSKTPVASSAFKKAPGWTILPDLHISKEKTTFGVMGVF